MDLIAAVRYGTPLTPQLLETHKLDKTDTDGMTALHIAVILTRADAGLVDLYVGSLPCTDKQARVQANRLRHQPNCFKNHQSCDAPTAVQPRQRSLICHSDV